MGEDAIYKMPEIEFTASFVLKLAQLGYFMTFVYWSSTEGSGTDAVDYLMSSLLTIGALSLFLSVPNARLAVTFGLPAIMLIGMVAIGETDDAIWAIIMIPMFGVPAYLPDMAMRDPTLGLEEEVLSQRTGVLYLIFAVFFVFLMMGITDLAIDGEFTEGEGDDQATYVLESSEKTLSQVALAMAVIGIIGFAMTAMGGVELGAARPWHFGALLAGCMVMGSYVFEVTMTGGITENPVEILWALAMGGLFTLVPCLAYEGNH